MNGTPGPDAEDVAGPRFSVRAVDESRRKVATVLSVVTSTTDGGLHTVTALLKPVVLGAEPVGGWILVKAGDTVLAQVNVKDGRAVASWTSPRHAALAPVVVTYTGDDLHAPASRALEL